MKWRSPQARVPDEPPMSSVTERHVPLNEPEAMPNDPGLSGHEARLQFHAVTKRFDDGTEALRAISFCVGAGELVAVVGPSGCGKSTLLRLASGLAAPTQGGVEVGAGPVGYVFQDATLLPWQTVLGNVELLGQLKGVPKADRRRVALAAIQTVGLTGSEDKYPRALSGGMKMRASLARALTMSPNVFLFDEPFGALDEITRQRLNEELLQLFQDRLFAALFVTHSVAEAVFLATRVLVMSGRPGALIADIAVPFGYPRSPELRYSAAFAGLAGQVGSALQEGHS
jgi:NitT/TauT family transport system ATP-binding protein